MNERRSFIGVLKGMFEGVVHPAEYIENGKRGSWGSALLLAIIFSILTPLLTFYLPVNRVIGDGRLERAIDKELPYFSLTEEGFYCEGRHVWTDNTTVYVEIDTDNTTVDDDVLEDLLQSADYQSVMIIYSKEMLLYSDGQTETLVWSDLYNAMVDSSSGRPVAFDKEDVVDFIKNSLGPSIRMIYFVLVVAAFLGFLLCGLLWALVGMIAASSSGAKISFGDLVKTSIYIRVIWSTIRKLLKVYVFGGTSMLMWVFGFVVILVYMILAVSKYAKRHPNNTYGTVQAGINPNMYYGGQSMGNMTGQYHPMGMNQGMNPNLNPNMYQNNPNMTPNMNPNMYQNNLSMNPNMYQNHQGMNQNMYQDNPGMNPNMYQNNPGMDQNMDQNINQNNLNMNSDTYQNNSNMSSDISQNDPIMTQGPDPYSYEENSEQQGSYSNDNSSEE